MSRLFLLAAAAALFVAALAQTPHVHADAASDAADLDRDGFVSILDITIVFDNTDPRSDVNNDGVADGFDVIAVLLQFSRQLNVGQATPTPSPTDVPPSPTPVPVTPTPTPGGRRTPFVPVTSTPTPTPGFVASSTLPPTPTRTPTPAPAGSRDKFKQPFSSTSIWNMPIGSNATFAPAGIKDWTGWGVFEEENYIFNDPNAPLTPIMYSSDGWSGGSRCLPDDVSSSPVVSVPLPLSFILPGASNGNTPNNASAMITQDGKSYVQTQPLTHCLAGGPWTSGSFQAPVSIYGDGIVGAQGGSHLSSIGGTIRVGEWNTARSEGRFRHALKTVLDPSNYGNQRGPGCNAPGCRWPAVSSDCGNSACGYTASNSEVMMGSLLALPPSYNCGAMRTEPGRIVCQTLKDYGMYVVDSGWAPAYLGAEHGPAGDTGDDFAAEFGFEMFPTSPQTAWAQDWRQMVTESQVVTNNSANSIGGGGTPRVPLAPPIGN